jgi:hypothetical protein
MVQPPVEANALPAGGFQKKCGTGNRDRTGALLGSGIGPGGLHVAFAARGNRLAPAPWRGNDMSSDEGKTNTAAAATAQAGAAPASKDQNVQMMANVNNGELQPPEGPSGMEASDALGRQLKKVYGKLLSEPVPDKFFELLKKLDQIPPGGKPDSGSKGT